MSYRGSGIELPWRSQLLGEIRATLEADIPVVAVTSTERPSMTELQVAEPP